MDDAHDPETERTRYMRLPWPLVAVGLLGIVVLALAAGLFANRYLRPQVGLVPTPVPVAVAPLATDAPAPQPTLTPQAQAPSSPTGTPVLTAVVPTQTPQVSISVTPSAQPTLDSLLVAEVTKAYEHYWQIRSQAVLDLDKTHLAEIMGEEHMDSVAHRIDELRAENRAIKTDVDHQFTVAQANPDSAQIFDDYISNSVYVDPVTKDPLGEPMADELQVLYRLSKIDGVWKVVDSVRAE